MQLHEALEYIVVGDGEYVSTGKRNLQFFLIPMVHWPDSMFTYCREDEILFSSNVFGQHYVSSERFVDELGIDVVMREAAKYYANIILLYGEQVKKVFEKLENLSFSTMVPSHGLIGQRKEDIEKIIDVYQRWAEHRIQNRAVIIYDTMWNSTKMIAYSVKNSLAKEEIPVEIFDLKINHISDIVASILFSCFIFIGSAVLNNQILPTVGALLTYLEGLKPQSRYVFTFGSYG